MSYASAMILDMVRPENEMFHSNGSPPTMVKIVTSHTLSNITLVSLASLTEYLAGFVEPEQYIHHLTDTLLMNDGSVRTLDENTIILRTGYEDMPDRTWSFQLSLEQAILTLN